MGHRFQGVFKAILVDRNINLLQVCRDVERNPVPARMLTVPGDRSWCSGRAPVGDESISSLDAIAEFRRKLERLYGSPDAAAAASA